MTKRSPFRYFKTSPVIIRRAAMLYVRFPPSLLKVADLLDERGIDVSQVTVRFRWNRFGPMLASEIRNRRVQQLRAYSNWQWHLNEVFVKIDGETRYLRCAVDHEGEVPESYGAIGRDRKAALKFLRKSMTRFGAPNLVVTDEIAFVSGRNLDPSNPDRQETGRW